MEGSKLAEVQTSEQPSTSKKNNVFVNLKIFPSVANTFTLDMEKQRIKLKGDKGR